MTATGAAGAHRRTAPERGDARRRDVPRRTLVAVLLVVVGLGLLAQSTYLVPDSAGYLAWGRSLLWDADVDFANEYRVFGMIDSEPGIRFGAPTPTGRVGNPFGMGTGLLWAPVLLLGRLLAGLCQTLGWNVGTQGWSTGTLFAAHLGSWTCVVFAWLLVDASLRAWMPRGAWRFGVTAAFLAMPLPYYTLQMATYAHAASVFTISLLLYLTLRGADAPTWRRAFAVGLVVGLAGLVRAQNLAFVVLPVCAWFPALRRRGHLRLLVAALLPGMLLAFLPQMIAWGRLYGSPLALPQGPGFVSLSLASVVQVLFATRHGLLTTTPIVLVAAALLVARRPPATGAIAVGLASCFVLQALINAMPLDWWAGWSFGPRRFCNLIPLLALGLALARTRRVRGIILAVMAANLVQWLRLSTRAVGGEADPGWGGLWGSGFGEFLPRVPGALLQLARTPWDEIAVLARPTAGGLQMRPDPFGFLLLLYAVWLVLLLVAVVPLVRRLRQGPEGGEGNSRSPGRV